MIRRAWAIAVALILTASIASPAVAWRWNGGWWPNTVGPQVAVCIVGQYLWDRQALIFGGIYLWGQATTLGVLHLGTCDASDPWEVQVKETAHVCDGTQAWWIPIGQAPNGNRSKGYINFNTSCYPNMNFKAVAAHEMGHAHGLDHTNLTGGTTHEIMDSPEGRDCVTQLSIDDADGIRARYPGWARNGVGFPANCT